MELFSTFRLGRLELKNRVVMAPMTRSRATGAVPNDLMRDYYTLRASAGLIISEGLSPSPNGLGYARIPGLYSGRQVSGWRSITESVRAAGGHMIAQLMHTGRIAHPLNLPAGARIVAPSAIASREAMWTDQAGMQQFPLPEAMGSTDIEQARGEFVQAAQCAIDAGFDGVELHAANGYLLEQFLHPHTNRRNDEYGGSVERRSRFVAEVASAVADAIGVDRVGIRVSPFSTVNDLPSYDEVEAQYAALASQLRGILYVHVVQNPHPGFEQTLAQIRTTFGGPIILNGGFDAALAEAALTQKRSALVSFGRPFIANPDLVERMRRGIELAVPSPATFYTPGPEGYLDYASATGRGREADSSDAPAL